MTRILWTFATFVLFDVFRGSLWISTDLTWVLALCVAVANPAANFFFDWTLKNRVRVFGV
jgi:hypothetical protein